MSYYVIPRAPIGPWELKSKLLGLRHIVRLCCHVVLVALLNKELRRQYCDNAIDILPYKVNLSLGLYGHWVSVHHRLLYFMIICYCNLLEIYTLNKCDFFKVIDFIKVYFASFETDKRTLKCTCL